MPMTSVFISLRIWLRNGCRINTAVSNLLSFGTQWCLNILRPRQHGRHFVDDILKSIFFDENVWISIEILLKCVPKGPINKIPSLDQTMAWRRPGDKPLLFIIACHHHSRHRHHRRYFNLTYALNDMHGLKSIVILRGHSPPFFILFSHLYDCIKSTGCPGQLNWTWASYCPSLDSTFCTTPRLMKAQACFSNAIATNAGCK